MGKPLLSHMLDRLKHAEKIDEIIICTSENPQDDPLEELAKNERVQCYRGSEEDVLVRLYEAACKFGVDYIVNITADCPLIDPFFVDQTVEVYKKTNADLIQYMRLPRGQGPNGIKVDALEKVCLLKAETETEVWGDYFTKSALFHFHNPEISSEYKHSTLKTSIDYPEDYEFLKCVFDELYLLNPCFSLLNIIQLVHQKPELLSINSHCAVLGREDVRRTATPARLHTS